MVNSASVKEPKRRRNAAATREALEGAARVLFAECGFDGTRTEEIARRARTNKAMIAYYFGGKQQLYSRVLSDDIAAAQARLDAVAGVEEPPAQRLASFIRALAEYGEENPHFPLMLVREQMNGGRHLEPHVREIFFGFFLRSQMILEDGIAREEFRPVDAHCTHLSLIGSLIYFLLTRPAREAYQRAGPLPAPIPTWQDYVEHVRELFVRGLRRASTDDGRDRTKGTGASPA